MQHQNTKMTEILMMTLTPQLRKKAIEKRAYHPSSFREPDLDFRKLDDKLEQAEITMKLEETEKLKLQYVNTFETNTTQIINIHDSNVDLTEKITEVLNIYEKNPNFKGKPSFKKWCNYCQKYGHSIAECRQKKQDNQNKPQKYKEPNKSFYQYMKKYQNLPNKNIHSNNSSGKPLPNNSNYSRNQSPYNSNYRGRSPEQSNSQNFSQNRYSESNSQNNQYRNNYSRSNSNRRGEFFDTSSHSNSRNRNYSSDRLRNSSYNRNRNYSNNRNRSYSNNRNQRYQNNRSRNNSLTDLIIKETITITIIVHKTTHKIGIPTTTIEEIILNPLIETTIVTLSPNTNIELTHRNISDKLIRYKQLNKQLQIPLVLTKQKIPNYN